MVREVVAIEIGRLVATVISGLVDCMWTVAMVVGRLVAMVLVTCIALT